MIQWGGIVDRKVKQTLPSLVIMVGSRWSIMHENSGVSTDG